MMRKRFALFGGALALAVGYTLFARTPIARMEAASAGDVEVVAATFSSAWCGACKILKPRLARVMPQFDAAPIRFVEYDFTFGEREEVAAKASAEGLAGVYGRFAGATGFTLLVDAGSGEIIDMLTINHSPEAMRAAISDALAVAEAASGGES